MAVIAYTQNAVLGAYQDWLMRQGAQACLERRSIGQDALAWQNMPDTVIAQAGSLVRYSVLTTLASVTVSFFGQFSNNVNSWQNVGEIVLGTSAGGIDRVTRPAVAGSYRNMVADVGTAMVSGTQVYVLVELGRINNGAFTPYAVLLSGYAKTDAPIDSRGGPGPGTTTTGGGGGCCLATTYSDIASGTTSISYTITPGAGQVGRVTYMEVPLQTDATVIMRYPYLLIQVGGSAPFYSVPNKSQGASTTYGYAWQMGGTPRDDVQGTTYYDLLPQDLWFSEPFDVRVLASNIQSGDDFGTATIFYELKGP